MEQLLGFYMVALYTISIPVVGWTAEMRMFQRVIIPNRIGSGSRPEVSTWSKYPCFNWGYYVRRIGRPPNSGRHFPASPAWFSVWALTEWGMNYIMPVR